MKDTITILSIAEDGKYEITFSYYDENLITLPVTIDGDLLILPENPSGLRTYDKSIIDEKGALIL